MAVNANLPKISILYDNVCSRDDLQGGFGFSCYVEWNGKKILFDTGGKRDVFFQNAQTLDIPLEELTSVVFSHHHWDHTAGIDELLKIVPENTTVCLPEPFSTSVSKKIPENRVQLKKVEQLDQIDAEVSLLVLKGSYWFCTSIYELSLLLHTAKGIVIITGCAHPGILKIIEKTKELFSDQKIHLVLGGFHLHRSWSCTSAKVVQKFKELGVEKVAPCHCAGQTAIQQFKEVFEEDCIDTETGTVIEV